MRLAVTGGTGLVGRFVVEEALAAGDDVTVLGRTPPRQSDFSGKVAFLPYDLDGAIPDLRGQDALVHAAFAHIPGRYRGGEGDDPEGFRRRNLDGLMRLLDAVQAAGLARFVFLSSRAVYGRQAAGQKLTEETTCHPDTLYGEVKLAGEACVVQAVPDSMVLRATGVYGVSGPGQTHKWAELFARAEAGEPMAPRIGSEVHGADLAAAVRLGLAGQGGIYNVSDILLDRRDLLREWARLRGCAFTLPAPADSASFNEMDCTRLRALGWQPGGWPALCRTIERIAAQTAPPLARALPHH